MRILFTASPFVGHVFPMLPLMHAARAAGHEVVLATGADVVPDVHRRGFPTWTVGPDLREIFADLALARATAVPSASHEEQLGRDALHLFARPSVRRTRDLLPRGDRLPPEFHDLPARPLVYLTLGTVFNDSEPVSGVLDAIQDLPISIAVTTGPAVDPSVLGPRPANVAAASFVPQALLMPLASAVVSHAGSGTMLGALASGLPQVCLPRGADQFANAERVQAVGAGVRLLPDEVTPERLRAVVSQVLEDPAYGRAARAMKAEIAAMPSAAEVLDDLVRLTRSERRVA